METFPEEFNFSNSNETFNKKVREEDLCEYRKIAYDKRETALKNKKEYFTIDLSNISEGARNMLINELLVKFPYIGAKVKKSDELYDLLSPLFGVSSRNRSNSIVRVTKENTYCHSTSFVIALTKHFSENMERYGWD